jgi:hypothetical protein
MCLAKPWSYQRQEQNRRSRLLPHTAGVATNSQGNLGKRSHRSRVSATAGGIVRGARMPVAHQGQGPPEIYESGFAGFPGAPDSRKTRLRKCPVTEGRFLRVDATDA